jgi:hypothetical protein
LLRDTASTIETVPSEQTERDTTSPGRVAVRRALRAWRRRVNRHRRRDGSFGQAAFGDLWDALLLHIHASTGGRIEMTYRLRPCDIERHGTCARYVGPLIWVMPNNVTGG